MTIYDELKARGLIAQVTDEAGISEMLNAGKATFYIGFDPTADSAEDIRLPRRVKAGAVKRARGSRSNFSAAFRPAAACGSFKSGKHLSSHKPSAGARLS